MFRKLLTWVIIAALAFWLVSNPAGAASAVHTAATAMSHAGSSLGKFVGGL
jgi:hypothetical protein